MHSPMNFITSSLLTLSLVSTVFLCSCGPEPKPDEEPALPKTDTVATAKDTAASSKAEVPPVYANARFRNVRATRQDDSSYMITGEAQVFEAAFSWIVEDGHNKLLEGHETASAGAPAWGSFRFQIAPNAVRSTSTLSLIMLEYSAKDGSPQYELPIPLPK